jgi:tRNA/rRNA methyltransferase
MAGTDSSRRAKSTAAEGAGAGPAIVLVRPQLPENIGMVARSMLNCGLLDLRLVRPKKGWPDKKAYAPAAGADEVLDRARLFDTTPEAVADLRRVYAATARERHMAKAVLTPRAAAAEMRAFVADGGRCGVLFGRESRGLENDDVALADALLSVPLNPGFSSLNLAQSVLVVAYEWHQTGDETPGSVVVIPSLTRPATKDELIGLFEHLERELDACGFLHVAEKRPTMVRNIRNLFQRAGLTEQEVRTLRGVIAGLVKGPHTPPADED